MLVGRPTSCAVMPPSPANQLSCWVCTRSSITQQAIHRVRWLLLLVSGGAVWWTLTRWRHVWCRCVYIVKTVCSIPECFRGELLTTGHYKNLRREIDPYLQVFTMAFMSWTLVSRPTFAVWSPWLIWAASCSSITCCAACQCHRKNTEINYSLAEKNKSSSRTTWTQRAPFL